MKTNNMSQQIRYIHTIARGYGKSVSVIESIAIGSNARFYAEDSGKKSSKEELGSVKMPGFIHPQTIHEEGHFTQKAKQQLEELKKKVEKPAVDNTERK